jgi:hypothetical protein
MAVIEGGLRARLIWDSFYELVRSTLDDRGWFDTGRRHAPIVLTYEPQKWDDPIEVNTVAIVGGDITDEEMELGSNLTEDRWIFYVDFFAESEAVGLDLITDLKESFRGKLPSIGRTSSRLAVHDYRQATPEILFYCDLENVLVDRGRDFPKPWLRFWHTVRVDVVDDNDA